MKNPSHALLCVLVLVIGICGFSSAGAKLAPWIIDYEKSKVRFIAEQAGAEFKGHWDHWDAEVRFDPAVLSESYAIANFHVPSVETFDPERDDTLQDPEWFDSEAHPIAKFMARHIKRNANGRFEAVSELEVKGLRTPIIFYFDVREEDGVTVLEGDAEIDRLAAGIGTGEWMDTNWIGQYVRVEVILYQKVGELLETQ